MVAKKKAPAKKKVAPRKKAERIQRDEHGLSMQQRRFVDEYMIDLNATQAYIRAGYKSRGRAAENAASRLLGHVGVTEAIGKAKAKRSEETAIDARYVLNRHIEIDQMDVANIMNDDGSLKKLSEWPKVWRTSLTGLEISEIMMGGDPIGTLKKIKWMDKTQNLKSLGQHVDIQAYKEKIELSGTEAFEALIEKRMKAIEGE
ncbi:MAG: terminase small subunit [Thiotrichales bacterium]|jgi:phage terminase small subunit|nr:terminase small subunit [Thiotrichales bacterium]MBT7912569.1 terminase small subunit [Candidatus Bathyarchaeota archaeon]